MIQRPNLDAKLQYVLAKLNCENKKVSQISNYASLVIRANLFGRYL